MKLVGEKFHRSLNHSVAVLQRIAALVRKAEGVKALSGEARQILGRWERGRYWSASEGIHRRLSRGYRREGYGRGGLETRRRRLSHGLLSNAVQTSPLSGHNRRSSSQRLAIVLSSPFTRYITVPLLIHCPGRIHRHPNTHTAAFTHLVKSLYPSGTPESADKRASCSTSRRLVVDELCGILDRVLGMEMFVGRCWVLWDGSGGGGDVCTLIAGGGFAVPVPGNIACQHRCSDET